MSGSWLRWKAARPTSGFQGIKRLELLVASPAQPALIVHLFESAADLTAEDFVITGGRRVRDLAWSFSEEGDTSVRLTFAAFGDHSTYTIRLRDDRGRLVDPFFASVDFVFTIGCERGDCRSFEAKGRRKHDKPPAVDLLTKDFTGFVHMLTDHVRVSNPHWADLSSASLERVLVDLVAHHGDMLSYYQDRVANEAFVEDASQRYSLRQHGRLLGYPLFDGSAAETILAFTAATSGYVPKGTEVTMPESAGATRAVFHIMEPVRVRNDHSMLAFAAWPGAADAELPEGSTRALLWGHIDELSPGQTLAFTQGAFSQVVRLIDAQQRLLPGWIDKPDGTPSSEPAEVTEIVWDPPLAAAVRPWGKPDPVLYGNLGAARFGARRTITIPLSKSALLADRQGAIVVREPREGGDAWLLRALRIPDGPVVFVEERSGGGTPRGVPLIEISLPQQRFDIVEHLHASQSYDAHCVVTADEDGSVWLQLGNGLQGMAVEVHEPQQAELTVHCYLGDPLSGNCAAGTLTHIVPDSAIGLEDFTDLRVTNVVPGRGGRRRESKEEARLRIPASLRHGTVQRAVCLDDYAAAACDVPGVARATARAIGGPFNTVLVLVDPAGQAGLASSVRNAVMDRLDAVRMAGREHTVSEAEYVPLDVKLAICVESGALPHRVRDAVYAALRPGTSERPGYFHPDRLSFGDAMELGDLLAHVQRVPGVHAVKALRFCKLGAGSRKEVEMRIRMNRAEVPRLDADDDYPEHGRLRVLVVGIDAGVSAKDFDQAEAT